MAYRPADSAGTQGLSGQSRLLTTSPGYIADIQSERRARQRYYDRTRTNLEDVETYLSVRGHVRMEAWRGELDRGRGVGVVGRERDGDFERETLIYLRKGSQYQPDR